MQLNPFRLRLVALLFIVGCVASPERQKERLLAAQAAMIERLLGENQPLPTGSFLGVLSSSGTQFQTGTSRGRVFADLYVREQRVLLDLHGVAKVELSPAQFDARKMTLALMGSPSESRDKLAYYAGRLENGTTVTLEAKHGVAQCVVTLDDGVSRVESQSRPVGTARHQGHGSRLYGYFSTAAPLKQMVRDTRRLTSIMKVAPGLTPASHFVAVPKFDDLGLAGEKLADEIESIARHLHEQGRYLLDIRRYEISRDRPAFVQALSRNRGFEVGHDTILFFPGGARSVVVDPGWRGIRTTRLRNCFRIVGEMSIDVRTFHPDSSVEDSDDPIVLFAIVSARDSWATGRLRTTRQVLHEKFGPALRLAVRTLVFKLAEDALVPKK